MSNGPAFAANISTMFTEVALEGRVGLAARAGFSAVEVQYPYEVPAAQLGRILRDHDVSLVLLNAPSGDRQGGEAGLACLADRREDYRRSVLEAIGYARMTGCPKIHILCGRVAGDAQDKAFESLAESLAWAADQAAPDNIRILIEAINRSDVPGYVLSDYRAAHDLLLECRMRAARPESVGLLFDVYHCHMSGLDVGETLDAVFPDVAHLQISDAPGRGEPGSGVIDWTAVAATTARLGYAGWIGCEYRPVNTTMEGLGWRERWPIGLWGPAARSVKEERQDAVCNRQY
ncbi:hydroxypyruvate isomerase family protein [Pseudochelatococcus sp. B33]